MSDADVAALLRALRDAGLHSSADTLVREADERGLLPGGGGDAGRAGPSRGGPRAGGHDLPGTWLGEPGGPVLARR